MRSYTFLMIGFVALGACKGAAGKAGAPGAMGASGAAGAAGTAGSDGVKGDPGPNQVTYIRQTVATPGASFAAPNTVLGGTWGPFTLNGYCYTSGANTLAEWYLSSTDATSKLTDYNTQDNDTPVNPTTGPLLIEYTASASSTTKPAVLEGPYDGTFAALSTDLATYITGSLTTGVYINGAAGPACQFAGFVVSVP